MSVRLACFALLLAATTLATAAGPLTYFGFEDGTLQGWRIVSGEAGALPTSADTARPDVKFGQRGKYFIGLYENPKHDEATIVLQSPVFTLKSSARSRC